MLLFSLALFFSGRAPAAGTWTPLANLAPTTVQLMLLLTDGTVMTSDGGGNTWHRLTPDIHGSYINGTWSTLASMRNTRLYYSSAVLRDGRVFVAGGEYGTGTNSGEVYDPVSNTWTQCPAAPAGQTLFYDSISKILPNGNVLIAPVGPATSGGTVIYNVASNVWNTGPTLYRGSYQDEASWVKLPDDSILTIDPFGQNCERYIPAANHWINDASEPVQIYDSYGSEMGPGFLLASGRAIFFGATGHNAIYTPSGSTTPGTWVAAPDFPNAQGMPDAAAAMLVNGKILCAVSPVPTSANHFPSPTSFYEYNEVSNAFTQVGAPGGGTTVNISSYVTTMLDLPDGSVLYSAFGNRLYVYQPDGSPLAAGKPVISSITENADGSYHLTGTLLNGISEGAAYGDDNQMNSNYPIIRLADGTGKIYYARTFNWSSTSVMTGSALLATDFKLPANLPTGNYSLVTTANGNSSDPVTVSFITWNGAVSGDWDTSTPNWLAGGSAATFSNSGNFVLLDDTLTGTTNLNLTAALTPGSVTFNNSRSNYVVSGVGKLTGATGLIKNGSGSLLLAETGGDDFSGGIALGGGTLILDNAGSAITGNTTIATNSILQIGGDDANGNLPAGFVTNNGSLFFNQTADALVGSVISGRGSFTKNDPNTLTLTATNTFTGGTVVNAGTLALSGTGSISTSTNIFIAAGAGVSATNRADGTLTLTNGQWLQGIGTIFGALAAGNGATVVTGTNGNFLGALTVSGSAILAGSTQMKLDAGNATNDQLSASAVTFGGALVLTNLSATPLQLGQSFQLFNATSYSGAFKSIVPFAAGTRLAWNTNSLAVNGTLTIVATPGDTWDGTVSGNWDLSTPNWWTPASETNFTPADLVTFDDSLTGTTNVILTTALTPGWVTFNNSRSNYFFSGGGKLSGATGISKYGTGSVTLAETGGDDFTGGITVNGGTLILDWSNTVASGGTFVAVGATLQAGLNNPNDSLPGGSITNNGSLILNRADNFSLNNLLSGSGTLVKTNANTLTLAANNSGLSGAAVVAQGTLRLGSINALGSGTNVSVTIANGAALDVNGVTGTNAVTVSGSGVNGNGAIVNNSSGAISTPALAFITLTANTTFGGTNRWDLRPAAAAPDTTSATFAGLSTGGHAYSLTKVGPNFIGLLSVTVDTNLANISVQAGTLDIEGNTTSLGNPTATLTVFTNATLVFLSVSSQLSKNVVLNDGATVLNSLGANTFNGGVVLGTNLAAGVANCTFNVAGTSLSLAGVVSGPGNLVKAGNAILYLAGANSFKGSTFVRAGTLALTGTGSISASTNIIISTSAVLSAAARSDDTLQLASGQRLQGNGTVNGILVAGAGSTLSAGTNSAIIGSLTVSSNVTLQGTTLLKLNPPAATTDAIHAANVTYGGTLVLTNISAAPLAAGKVFRPFFANTYSGAFAALNPATPGPGLRWNTNSLTVGGTLGVVALAPPGIASFNLSGNSLVINATNGVAGTAYNILTSTNLALPLAQWSPVATNTLASGGSFVITATNATAGGAAQQFYILQAQ